jgi:SulP family sulfate permease
MQRMSFRSLLAREFAHYNAGTFRADLLAGLTVAAVALPLALAFGVASGATAAAGVVTAVLAGLIIGALSGAPYQISGPTGAMSAVLVLVSQRYGMEGVWIAGVLSGILILVIGILRLGRFIAFIPAPVISGFTTGIAIIIFVGQIDNFLGVKTPSTESAAFKFLQYFEGGWTPNWQSVALGTLVIVLMVFWPARWARFMPGSLVGIIVASVIAYAANFQVAVIGEIPRTILLDQRLSFGQIPWGDLQYLIAPTISIAALGAIESLLCGAVASKMTGIRLHSNQELIAQGVGNIIIPFFGGVPATAAIARTSVGIKSGGQTRMVSIIHALAILAAALLFAPVIAHIPLTALAGVLMVTAFRMNEWASIRFMFGRRFKTASITYLITMIATISLDLTQAIIIGGVLSAIIFMNEVSSIEIDVRDVDVERMRQRGMELKTDCKAIRVAFLTGPLFFAATGNFNEAVANEEDAQVLILSMRAVPLIDITGIEAVRTLYERMHEQGKVLMMAAVQPRVMAMLERSGVDQEIGKQNFFWSADRAILVAEQRYLLTDAHTAEEALEDLPLIEHVEIAVEESKQGASHH